VSVIAFASLAKYQSSNSRDGCATLHVQEANAQTGIVTARNVQINYPTNTKLQLLKRNTSAVSAELF